MVVLHLLGALKIRGLVDGDFQLLGIDALPDRGVDVRRDIEPDVAGSVFRGKREGVRICLLDLTDLLIGIFLYRTDNKGC